MSARHVFRGAAWEGPVRWCRVAALLAAMTSPVSAQVGPLTILDHIRVDPRKPIDFHAAAYPETLYVGQQVTYQVAVLLNAEARARLRRNPEFLPPELRGLLAYELGTPTRVPPRVMQGGEYEAHVFQRALFPVAAGSLAVPAPQLTYGLPQSSSYFSREERYVVRAESAHLVIRSLPLEGRPDTFTGAVGVLRAIARLSATTARVGDPLVLTLRLQGTGNVKLLPRPSVEIEWASAVPGSERVVVDTSGPLVRGAKEFDWILTPTQDGSVVLPVLRYDYFDPYLKQYSIAETKPTPLVVDAGVLAVDEIGESVALLPLRARGGAAPLLFGLELNRRTDLLGVLALCLLAPMVAVALSLPRRAPRPTPIVPVTLASLRGLEATAGEDPHATAARGTRRVLHALLASRLSVPAHQIVGHQQLERVLRRRGVSRATTHRVMTFFDELDQRGFAGSDIAPVPTTPFADTATALLASVDKEAVRSGRAIPLTSRTVLFGSALLACMALVSWREVAAQAVVPDLTTPVRSRVGAADQDAAVDAAFTLASDAYLARRFSEASSRFADLARQQPGDVGILANWGTAAWANGDTVEAVMGWQRAARLDPMAADLHERLALLPAGARGGFADVPVVPVPVVQAIAIAAWVLAWCVFAVCRRRRMRGATRAWDRALRVGAASLGVVSMAAVGVAIRSRAALSVDGLAIIMRPETMHVAPGADADAMGGVSTGDVVQLIERRDAWQHVRHSDGRVGWVPAIRLVALSETSRSE